MPSDVERNVLFVSVFTVYSTLSIPPYIEDVITFWPSTEIQDISYVLASRSYAWVPGSILAEYWNTRLYFLICPRKYQATSTISQDEEHRRGRWLATEAEPRRAGELVSTASVPQPESNGPPLELLCHFFRKKIVLWTPDLDGVTFWYIRISVETSSSPPANLPARRAGRLKSPNPFLLLTGSLAWSDRKY